MQGTGAVSQALGIPYGLGGPVEQQFMEALTGGATRGGVGRAMRGRGQVSPQFQMTAQQYQMEAGLIAFGQDQMGYSDMLTGYGLGPQALAVRQMRGLPTPPPGAQPIYGQVPGGGQGIYNIWQHQHSRKKLLEQS